MGMSEQERQATTIQRPLINDPEAWKAYWTQAGVVVPENEDYAKLSI